MGLELGYDFTGRNRKSFRVIGTGVTGRINSQVQGAHLDLLAFIPVMDCTEVMFGMGIGLVQGKYNVTFNNAPAGFGTAFASSSRTTGASCTFRD